MEVTQEQFDKLSQMDRIEFRQVEDRIKERTYSSYFPQAAWFSIGIVFFILILGLLTKSAFGGVLYLKLFNLLYTFVPILVVGMILCFISDVYYIIRRRKLLNELESKFFKSEIKKKS